jgi:hypothetical protein
MWCANSKNLNIIEDIFRKSKRIREVDAEDIMGENTINIAFEINNSESSQTSVPANTIVLELEGTNSHPSFLPYNSVNNLHQIYLQRIGPEVQNTPKVEGL